jgi:hypothetical protein
MTNEVTKYDNNRYKQLEKRVLDLPSISNEALSEIAQGYEYREKMEPTNTKLGIDRISTRYFLP